MSDVAKDKRAGAPAVRAGIALGITVASTVAAIFLFGSAAYDLVKAVHVIAVIAWMAGMLYLPRLFVYHADSKPGSEQSETFKVMEFRLMTIIMNPAMIVAWVLGLWLAWEAGFFSSGWFHAKLALVVAMSAAHGILSAAMRRFAEDRNEKSSRYWRMMNEVPTVLMFGIVILVIVKPF
ncbi:MAG: protoporphyrinogen oxidase HemJ [Alphaproteobacteria bacterium]|nr:protoporphyrinogen oxidase HemJ [Alphaproteobacteria bacterium]